jgi:short-subunit dehydrogenase
VSASPAPAASIPTQSGWALVTGASSGIGAEFARQIAAQGRPVTLLARRRDRLESLATELRNRYNVQAEAFPADLSRPDEVGRVAAHIAAAPGLDLLVNNAGFGTTERFDKSDLTRQMEMLQVHLGATVHLSHAALQGMVQRRRGAIINVASVAAFIDWAGAVNYGSTKAYLVAFSRSLDAELHRKGVRVQALCPGFTGTEFHDTPDLVRFDRSKVPGLMWSRVEDVVSESLRAIPHGPSLVIPGWPNKMIALFARSPLFNATANWVSQKLF